MEMAQLEAFVEATQWGSFRRAAESLLLSQPALSERIKRLETEVGQPLFERFGRGVRLTESGRALLPFAEQSLKAMRDGREAARSVHTESMGVLNVASARAVGTYVLPDVIARLKERHAIDVHMRSGRSSEVLNLVLERAVDVGIGRALTHPEVETVRMYDEAVVLVTHPRHRFALSGRASIFDVGKEPLILYDRDSLYFTVIDRVCREAGMVPNVAMMLDSIEATKQMVERGLGVSFLPSRSIQREVQIGAMATVPLIEEHRVTLGTVAYILRRQPRSDMVQEFLAILREVTGGRDAAMALAAGPVDPA